jgi:hypothetical protein
MFENRVLRGILGPQREEVQEDRENYKIRTFIICTDHHILPLYIVYRLLG